MSHPPPSPEEGSHEAVPLVPLRYGTFYLATLEGTAQPIAEAWSGPLAAGYPPFLLSYGPCCFGAILWDKGHRRLTPGWPCTCCLYK